MGMYQHVRKIWKQPRENLGDVWKERLVQWRAEPITIRIHYPTRIDKARALGYKAKQGYFIVRQRVRRGGHIRPNIVGGRKPKNSTQRLTLRKNYQLIAEERANRWYNNCEVLNSYYVGEDGNNYWYEIIMVDVDHPAIKADPRINWICNDEHKGRAYRGLTSAGRKMRGLRITGKGAEKVRPSRPAYLRRKHKKQM